MFKDSFSEEEWAKTRKGHNRRGKDRICLECSGGKILDELKSVGANKDTFSNASKETKSALEELTAALAKDNKRRWGGHNAKKVDTPPSSGSPTFKKEIKVEDTMSAMKRQMMNRLNIFRSGNKVKTEIKTENITSSKSHPSPLSSLKRKKPSPSTKPSTPTIPSTPPKLKKVCYEHKGVSFSEGDIVIYKKDNEEWTLMKILFDDDPPFVDIKHSSGRVKSTTFGHISLKPHIGSTEKKRKL